MIREKPFYRPICTPTNPQEGAIRLEDYEIVVLFEATPDGIETAPEQLSKVEGLVTTNSGSVTEIHQWGRRRLAYEIDKRREAFYTLFKVNLDRAAIEPINEGLRLEAAVVRYLIAKDEGGIGPVMDLADETDDA